MISGRPLATMARIVAAMLFASVPAIRPAYSASAQVCDAGGLVLWGDGQHDDTKALNAWFKGEQVAWAKTGSPVGPVIVGHVFRLSSTVYMPSGTDRRFEGFQMVWPSRRERVSGGTIFTGDDPDKPATMVGVVKTGADPDEGVPYAAPSAKPHPRQSRASCLVS